MKRREMSIRDFVMYQCTCILITQDNSRETSQSVTNFVHSFLNNIKVQQALITPSHSVIHSFPSSRGLVNIMKKTPKLWTVNPSIHIMIPNRVDISLLIARRKYCIALFKQLFIHIHTYTPNQIQIISFFKWLQFLKSSTESSEQ